MQFPRNITPVKSEANLYVIFNFVVTIITAFYIPSASAITTKIVDDNFTQLFDTYSVYPRFG